MVGPPLNKSLVLSALLSGCGTSRDGAAEHADGTGVFFPASTWPSASTTRADPDESTVGTHSSTLVIETPGSTESTGIPETSDGTAVGTDTDASAETESSSDTRWAPEFGNLFTPNERSRWIGNSFMALQNLHVEAVIAANQDFVVETYPRTRATASAENAYAGWFYGQGLWLMDPVVDAIAAEGGYDTCVLTSGPWEGGDPSTAEDDDEPLGGTRDFITALQPWCDQIILYVTWGHFGLSPTRNPSNYDQAIAEVLGEARRVEAHFPDVTTVPLALVFHDLMTHPPFDVPRADYLHQPNDDPHQNLLGTMVIAWTFYAVATDTSPVGADYDFTAFDPPFIVEDVIGLGVPSEPFAEGARQTLALDRPARMAIQARIWELVQQWRTHTTSFDR